MEQCILDYINRLKALPDNEKINKINEISALLKTISPFESEPVSCVTWVPADYVHANDYNPNAVASAEMKLLELSIKEDGYTQPIVVWKSEDNEYEVVDGYHRNIIGKTSKDINKRIKNYLPVVIINQDVTDKGQRIASTIRHNRARGVHKVDAMSDIVADLKKRNWSNTKIATKLGMSDDEVLRLSQITGIAELFKDRDFSMAWTANPEEMNNTNLIDEKEYVSE